MKNSLRVISAVDDKPNNRIVVTYQDIDETKGFLSNTLICKYEIDPVTNILTFRASGEFVGDILALLNKNVEVSHEG